MFVGNPKAGGSVLNQSEGGKVSLLSFNTCSKAMKDCHMSRELSELQENFK